MKSIQERLADKKLVEEKRAMKRTGRTYRFNLSLPHSDTYVISRGDMKYMKERALIAIAKITTLCPKRFLYELFFEIKKYLLNGNDTARFKSYGEDKLDNLIVVEDDSGGHQTADHYLILDGKLKIEEMVKKKETLDKLNKELKELLDYRYLLTK